MSCRPVLLGAIVQHMAVDSMECWPRVLEGVPVAHEEQMPQGFLSCMHWFQAIHEEIVQMQ